VSYSSSTLLARKRTKCLKKRSLIGLLPLTRQVPRRQAEKRGESELKLRTSLKCLPIARNVAKQRLREIQGTLITFR
jgi:hypothetical protein